MRTVTPSKRVAADSCGKDSRFRSCEAHHFGVRAKEDRGGSKSTVGEDQGAGEESGVARARTSTGR
jgi:hypothetical protein